MKYVLDTEFIDTPTCSALISLAVLREDGEWRYFEFDYPKEELTPWLLENVVPHLTMEPPTTFAEAASDIAAFVGRDVPEFWCYYGAYDWYWFCRLWGGFLQMPKHWPHLFREFAYVQQGVPNIAGAEHNALNDCRSILAAMRTRGVI